MAVSQLSVPVFSARLATVFAPMIFSEVSLMLSSNEASLTTLNFTCLRRWVNAKAGCLWAPVTALAIPLSTLAHMISCPPVIVHLTLGAVEPLPAV